MEAFRRWRWAHHHLLKLGASDAYDGGEVGVDGARRDGRQFPASGRAGGAGGGGLVWRQRQGGVAAGGGARGGALPPLRVHGLAAPHGRRVARV